MSDLIVQNEQDLMDALASIDKTRFETKEEYEAEVERISVQLPSLFLLCIERVAELPLAATTII